MMFVLKCLVFLPCSIPSFAIVYRLIKNKCFGSVFNITTTAIFILTGLICPVLSAANISLLSGDETDKNVSCIIYISLHWVLVSSLLTIGILSLLYKDVMVANAHQDPGQDGGKIFNIGYLVGVTGFVIALNVFHLMQNLVHGIPFTSLCLGESTEPSNKLIIIIPAAFSILFLTFLFLINFKTRYNLRRLSDQHLKNLPSNNVLTYLDTQILSFIILLFFIIKMLVAFTFLIDVASFEATLFVNNVIQLIIHNVIISLVFPIYIILKTRRYLPRLWDSDAPLIVQNNDFFALRLSQVTESSF